MHCACMHNGTHPECLLTTLDHSMPQFSQLFVDDCDQGTATVWAGRIYVAAACWPSHGGTARGACCVLAFTWWHCARCMLRAGLHMVALRGVHAACWPSARGTCCVLAFTWWHCAGYMLRAGLLREVHAACWPSHGGTARGTCCVLAFTRWHCARYMLRAGLHMVALREVRAACWPSHGGTARGTCCVLAFTWWHCARYMLCRNLHNTLWNVCADFHVMYIHVMCIHVTHEISEEKNRRHTSFVCVRFSKGGGG